MLKMWKDLKFIGDDDWIEDVIAHSSLVAGHQGDLPRHVLGGIQHHGVFQGRDRLVDLLPGGKQFRLTMTHQGEPLLGLMAIHLILLAVNKVSSSLKVGSHLL